MTKTAAISEQILIKLAETGSLKQAFDAVLGEGAYAGFASQLYEELRARARR